MPETVPTLQAVFSVTQDEATDAIIRGVTSKVWSDVGLPTWLVKAGARKIASTMNAVLATPLSDILSGGWNTYRRYCKYADAKQYPAGVEHEVPEGAFSIDSTHTPRVELVINGQPRGSVTFPVKVTLTFDGALVVVRDGRFVAVKAGSCTATGTLCCEKAVLKELKSAPVVLPGVIHFGAGIPIVRCV